MSVFTFIASDHPLPEIAPQRGYPLIVHVDEGTVYEDDADDNFGLYVFRDVQKYTDKKYGAELECPYMTDRRAEKMLKYIRNALEHDDTIEIWHVWLTDYYEYEESPVIQKCTVPFSDVTVDDIKEIIDAEVWNTPDKRHPNRPSFYCLIIAQ